MSKKLFLFLLIAVCLGFLILSEPAFATTTVTRLTNPLGITSIPELVGRIIKAALGIVGSIALLMFIYGGFTLLTSSGNDKMVQKGKNIIVWATIGLVVIFVSYVAVNFVINSLTGVVDETASTSEGGGGVCVCNFVNPELTGDDCNFHDDMMTCLWSGDSCRCELRDTSISERGCTVEDVLSSSLHSGARCSWR